MEEYSKESIELLVQAMRSANWTDRDIRSLAQFRSLHRIAQVLRGETLLLPTAGPGLVRLEPVEPEPLPSNAYYLKVEAGRSLSEQILAGKYNWWQEEINENNFPEPPLIAGTLIVEVIHLGRRISTEDAKVEFAGHNLRPATLRELLIFGEQHPLVQQGKPVVALGSFCVNNKDHHRHVPFLRCDSHIRTLDLGWDTLKDVWVATDRFLTVRKTS